MENNQLNNAGFLGRGLAFPPTFDRDICDLKLVAGSIDIQQSLEIILGTRPNERVLQPDFGANLDEFLFEPLDSTNISLLQDIVTIALVRHEPRIEVNLVQIEVEDELAGRILIRVDYNVRGTNSRFNFVYPFYLEEGTDIQI